MISKSGFSTNPDLFYQLHVKDDYQLVLTVSSGDILNVYHK